MPANLAPAPANEVDRIAELERLDILDTLPEQPYDDIVSLASQICRTPIALVSLTDHSRQWFKARFGLAPQQVRRDYSFCSHTILSSDTPFIVEDASHDARFATNPLVAGEEHIRFYAGAPITTNRGYVLGAVCVIDRKPRTLAADEAQTLSALARQVSSLFELRRLQNSAKQEVREEATSAQQIEHLMAVASNSLDLQSYIDRNYTYRYVNQTYLNYWHKNRDDIAGRTAAEVWGEKVFREVVKPKLDRALAGELVEYQTILEFPGRGVRYADVAYIPARDANGAIVGAVVRAHDVNKLKKMDQQLRSTIVKLKEKNLSQERLIHTLSHDLREPVNTLTNFSSLLLDEHVALLPEEAKRYLRFLRASSERLRQLLDDLLSLVRLDQDAAQWATCDLNVIFDGVVTDLHAAVSRNDAVVTRNQLPTVIGQHTLLQLLLQNLLANALKFVASDVAPVISLDAVADGDYWQLRLTDNGIGVAEPYREKVFDLFTRLHSRHEYEGTGFGLAACRRIVELHGGRIWIEAPASGGSCFCLTLPMNATDHMLDNAFKSAS